MSLHEAEESHQHYLRQKVCGASLPAQPCNFISLFARAICQPVHNAYQIWSISIQWIQCVCTGVCVSVCVCRCLCTVHRFTRSSTCSIQRMEDREAGSQWCFFHGHVCCRKKHKVPHQLYSTRFLERCTVALNPWHFHPTEFTVNQEWCCISLYLHSLESLWDQGHLLSWSPGSVYQLALGEK